MEATVPWRVRDAALTFALGLGGVALLFAAAIGLDALQGPSAAVSTRPPAPPAALAAGATSVFYLILLIGVWLLVVRRYGVSWRTLGLAPPQAASLLPVLLLAALFIIGSTLILLMATLAVGALGGPAYLAPAGGAPRAGAAGLVLLAVVTSLLLAPVAEELFFRGVLYQAMRQRMGKLLATGGSALLFTLVHARLAVTPESFLLGVVLALAFERTGSLYPSMCIHAAYNGVIVALALHAA